MTAFDGRDRSRATATAWEAGQEPPARRFGIAFGRSDATVDAAIADRSGTVVSVAHPLTVI